MSSERDSFAKGIFSTFAKGFLLHKLLLKVNYLPLRVKKSRSHDMGHCGLARHFKTDPTNTVALCFGYAKTLCWRADDKQMNRTSGFSWPSASFQNKPYWDSAFCFWITENVEVSSREDTFSLTRWACASRPTLSWLMSVHLVRCPREFWSIPHDVIQHR
jgi:hypothetical protein